VSRVTIGTGAHVAGLGAERLQDHDDATATTFADHVSTFERHLITGAIQAADGVQTRAARRLGMSERHPVRLAG
jgi:transcriptional regulator with GAF, ATPase, and Fis domain